MPESGVLEAIAELDRGLKSSIRRDSIDLQRNQCRRLASRNGDRLRPQAAGLHDSR